MFLMNVWQVAAHSAELKRAPLSRTLLGEDVVLFRTADGTPVALLDECPHRLAPLSKGRVVGNVIECGYHGMCFDASGACVRVPGQEHPPSGAKVKSFPTAERYKFVWVWLGDSEKADQTEIPDFHWMDDADWAISEGYHHIDANYQLLNDNLLDLSHETFVHSHTIGNAAVADAPLMVSGEGGVIRAHRDMLNCEVPPFYVKATGFTGRIDRWHTTIFTPPAFLVIENGSMPAGSNKDEARKRGITRERRVLNLITPETEASSHYFWAIARCYSLNDAELTDYIRSEVSRTFDEDKIILEAQQKRMGERPFQEFPVTLRADAGAVQARRLMKKLLVEQAGAQKIQAQSQRQLSRA